MAIQQDPPTFIYPHLGSSFADIWIVRLSGHGLGNCFYNYFHAVVLAEKHGARIVAPPWFSIKLGPLLRRERSKRFYWRMFRPYKRELHGLRKIITLVRHFKYRNVVTIGYKSGSPIVAGVLNTVTSENFTFHGLHPYRDTIRERLLGIVNDPIPPNHSWGQSDFVAVHIRLGDFAPPAHALQGDSGQANTRIPLSWYVHVVRALRVRYPKKAIRIFSDGRDEELQPLLQLGATVCRSGSDITDLLAMASASILVGSNSTYSRWAAFLGDMPSIWLASLAEAEKPSAADTPILFVPLDAVHPTLWSQ